MNEALKIELFSDSRFETLVAEASVDGKFLFGLRRDNGDSRYVLELRSDLFVPGSSVQEVGLDVLLEAIGLCKRALGES